MNAPNMNFGSDRDKGGLPMAVSPNARQLAPEFDRALVGNEGEGSAIEGERSNYRELFFKYLGLALKHRWLILAICGASLVIGFGVTYTSTPIYRATATIQIDREAARVVKVDALDQAHENTDILRFYQTQYDLLKSRSLAERVATDLALANEPTFLSPKSQSPWARLWGILFPARVAEERNFDSRKAAHNRPASSRPNRV